MGPRAALALSALRYDRNGTSRKHKARTEPNGNKWKRLCAFSKQEGEVVLFKSAHKARSAWKITVKQKFPKLPDTAARAAKGRERKGM